MAAGEHPGGPRIEVAARDERSQPDAVVVPHLDAGHVADAPALARESPEQVDVLADAQRLVEAAAPWRSGGRAARCWARRRWPARGDDAPAGPMSSAEWRAS